MAVEPYSPVSFAQQIAADDESDVVLYNGPIDRSHVLRFAETIFRLRVHPKILLILVTDGGDPDAAYKMMRYLHRRYSRVVVMVPGNCKSAGTLAAIGAHQIAFAPFGELGPLDIQSYKTDNLSGMESGLTISEAIDTLVRKAMDLHREHYTRILTSTGRVVSFGSAAKVATELVTGLVSPIFARIDPYDVGQKARSMRIANDYGERLAAVTQNVKANALATLTRGYPTHSFVIDMEEARELFENVRGLTDREMGLVEALGDIARVSTFGAEPIIYFLSAEPPKSTKEEGDDSVETTKNSDGNRRTAAGEIPHAGSDTESGAGQEGETT